jgi:hypothetical protein
MFKIGKTLALAVALIAVPASALAASGATRLPGTWRKLPAAPSSVFGTSVWTGKQLIVFGTKPFTSTTVVEAYDPAADAWSSLATPSGRVSNLGYKAVWTGTEMLAWNDFQPLAYSPATKQWRPLRRSVPGGIVVWTGREAIGWGGGCCGDARSNGAAYRPATDTFRTLARSPLAPSQSPVGAWTGRELVLVVGGLDPDGKPYPARFARAAAYNPRTNTWRRLAPEPERGGTAVWDGHELLVVGAGLRSRSAFAFNPATNRWRRLGSVPSSRAGASAAWTGKRLLLWSANRGLAYDPKTNRWSALPSWPLRARGGPIVAWTGRSLIVWGGEIGTPVGTSTPPKFPLDGAAFTPTAP